MNEQQDNPNSQFDLIRCKIRHWQSQPSEKRTMRANFGYISSTLLCSILMNSSEILSFYTWGKHQQARGANSVASALTHFLKEKLNSLDNEIKTVRIFSDSGIGQTKTFTALLALNMLAAKTKSVSIFFSGDRKLLHAGRQSIWKCSKKI